MTVAAVIVAGSAESALADAAGRASARRIAETAWAGGAVPIVIVAPDPTGSVALSLAGASAALAEPAPGTFGLLTLAARGIDVARAAVGETDAVLVWPVEHAWVDAETVTSLIQAHGIDPAACVAPAWQGTAGWPVLIPVATGEMLAGIVAGKTARTLLDALATLGDGSGSVLGVRLLDLGDPGAVLDLATELTDLPAYLGPAGPLVPPPEWGAAAADRPDDAPLEGPPLAPHQPAR